METAQEYNSEYNYWKSMATTIEQLSIVVPDVDTVYKAAIMLEQRLAVMEANGPGESGVALTFLRTGKGRDHGSSMPVRNISL